MDTYERLDKLTVAEAAERLGVKEQAVRKRIARGTLQHTKDEDGRVSMYLSPSDNHSNTKSMCNNTGHSTYTYSFIRSLEDQMGFLRREVEDWKDDSRRTDAIIMSLTQRIPELEGPREPPDAPQAVAKNAGGVEARPFTEEAQEGSERRSWWRRWFGG